MKVSKKYVDDRMFDVRIKTRQELLKKLDMHSDTFNKKMSGEREWKLNELWKLSQVLDCEISDLLYLEEKGDI